VGSRSVGVGGEVEPRTGRWRQLQLHRDSGSPRGAQRWWRTPLEAGSGHLGCNRGGGTTDLEVGWASSVAIRVGGGSEAVLCNHWRRGSGSANSVAASISSGGVAMGYPRLGRGR
jgi:hypothetical protein